MKCAACMHKLPPTMKLRMLIGREQFWRYLCEDCTQQTINLWDQLYYAKK